MEIYKAKKIILSLANGIHPVTGDELDENNLYNHPVVIRALFTIVLGDKDKTQTQKKQMSSEKIISKQEANIRDGKPKNNGFPWTQNLREEARNKFLAKYSITSMAKYFDRTKGSIISLLVDEGLINYDDNKTWV